MALVTSKEMLTKARKGGYAVGAFNAENMEMVKAIIAAAEELKAPVMIQTTPSTVKYGTSATYAAIVKAEAEKASVPVCMHLDHGSSYELAEECIGNGYTSVMIDGSKEDFENIWIDYFDFEKDYCEIKTRLSSDETLKKACEFAGGIRLLKQDSWECLCSFIISQNNNIPRIKTIISRLCEHYGHFPTASEMAQETVESLGYLRSGFRAKYLVDAACKTASGEINLREIKEMPIDDARKALMTIKGVGPKVAECVLLFGMHRCDAFPVDVWIKRVMEKYYPDGLPDCTKKIEGIAQQYLFHYVRNLEK